jgi:hypothetical protein
MEHKTTEERANKRRCPPSQARCPGTSRPAAAVPSSASACRSASITASSGALAKMLAG